MINIMICDDENEVTLQLANVVSNFPDSNMCHIESFLNSEDAIKSRTRYDIAILDIDMPHVNGFNLAKHLKEKNADILIIFFSCKDHLVFDSFCVHPYDFIRKSESDEIISRRLCKAFEIIGERKSFYVFKKKYDATLIPFREIVFFYKTLNDLHICTVTEEYTQRKALKDVTYPSYFFKITASLIVNMEFVKSYSETQIFLRNGKYFNIGKQKMRVFNKAYLNYISELY